MLKQNRRDAADTIELMRNTPKARPSAGLPVRAGLVEEAIVFAKAAEQVKGRHVGWTLQPWLAMWFKKRDKTRCPTRDHWNLWGKKGRALGVEFQIVHIWGSGDSRQLGQYRFLFPKYALFHLQPRLVDSNTAINTSQGAFQNKKRAPISLCGRSAKTHAAMRALGRGKFQACWRA